jgi:hypothetical protein
MRAELSEELSSLESELENGKRPCNHLYIYIYIAYSQLSINDHLLILPIELWHYIEFGDELNTCHLRENSL